MLFNSFKWLLQCFILLVGHFGCHENRNYIILPDIAPLRTVPTIVIAHTFCASRDTRVFLSVMLTNTGIFLRGLKLSVESRS